jgi:YD repeat-containing protein
MHARTPGLAKASPVVPDSVDGALPPEVPKALGNLLKEYAGTHFEYDARGNLIGKSSPAGRQQYEWDGFNRLRIARVEESERRHEARYFYDPFGRWIGKDVDGVRTVFGWDGDRLAYESGDSGTTQYVYEPESFVPLAQYVTTQPLRAFRRRFGGKANRTCRKTIRFNACRKGSRLHICSTTIATRSACRC